MGLANQAVGGLPLQATVKEGTACIPTATLNYPAGVPELRLAMCWLYPQTSHVAFSIVFEEITGTF